MSASESTDCYLCGARNDVDADFCVRCDGQLLRLPTDAIDLAEENPTELIDDQVPDAEENIVQRRARRLSRSGSVEDQRLSDALGLFDDDELDPDLIDTVVTSIPKATASASIPLIGTRTGMVPQKAMHTTEVGPRVYVLLALLLLATAWLGWSTLTGADEATPDNLAFTNTTVPPTTTTTTEVGRREWSEAEVEGKYGAAFTRVQLFDCPTETEDGARSNIEPDDDLWTAGVAVDDYNVLVNTGDLRSATVAVVRARNGAQRLAIVRPGPPGTRIATTISSISRNLELHSASEGTADYFLSYDAETNVVDTSGSSQGSPIELTVSNLGDVLSLRIGPMSLDDDALRSINHRIERVEEEDAPQPVTVCDRALQLAPTTPVPPTDNEEAN